MGRRRISLARNGEIQLRLHPGEDDLIRSLVAQLQQLLAGDDDPNLRRLSPPAHPDRDDLQAEYHEMVHDQLLRSRFEALDVVESTLDEPTLTDDELGSWMRAVNDLRLVLGTRLDVSEDGHDIDPSDPDAGAYVLYDWLGVVLNDIVETRSQLL